MIAIGTGIFLLSASLIAWFFGTRPYVAQHKGIDHPGASIAVSAWNDFAVAREVRKKTKKECPYIEIFAVTLITGAIMIAIGLLSLI